MPYIGNTIRAADDYRLIDDISSSFNGSTTSFALQVAGSAPVPFPKSPQQVLISVNGVIQEPDPTGASGFNLVGTNIVFSSAPTNGHAFFGIIYATADYLNAGGNFPSGSLGAPSITFIGDENSGLYRKSGGSVGFVSDATEIANFDSNGITISSGNLIITDSIIHSGDSNTKIRFSASDRVTIETGGSERFRVQDDKVMVSVDFKPDTDSARDLGTNTNRFANGYFDTLYGDGSNLTGINTDLVSDTSPQLGGNLDTNDKNIVFGDSDGGSGTDNRAVFGAGSDLKIYHNGSDSYIEESGTGDLIITSNTIRPRTDQFTVNNAANTENMISAQADGAVSLFHNGSTKFATTSTGATVTGNLLATGVFQNDTGGEGLHNTATGGKFYSNVSNDTRLEHSANAQVKLSFIAASSTYRGAVSADASAMHILTGGSGEQIAVKCIADGATELRHSGSKKLETTANGFNTQGSGQVEFIIGSTNAGGAVLYLDGDSDGDASGGANYAYIFHNTAGALLIRNRVDNAIHLGTNDTERWYVYNTGHFVPAANNTYDIGTSSVRVRNIYTNDLHLSNEGSSNDVDSTWGNYTIQEGHEDLFLINNRTGKKFKFNLTEVS